MTKTHCMGKIKKTYYKKVIFHVFMISSPEEAASSPTVSQLPVLCILIEYLCSV